MNKTVLGFFRESKWIKRSIVYISVFMLHMQAAMVAHATPLASSTIQSDLAYNPLFELSPDDSDHQYTTSDFMEESAPSAMSLASFYKKLEDDHRAILGAPTYVPIQVGAITTIIPTYEKPRYVGSPLVQSRYIRYQVQTLLGRNLIDATDSKYATEVAQLNTLYANALFYIQNENPDVVYGDNLNLDQENSGLANNMVWPEFRVINGEKVVVPVVYLTADTVAEFRVTDHETQLNGHSQFNNLFIDNVTVEFGRDAFLELAGDLNNNSGTVAGDGNLTILSHGNVHNLTGLIDTQGDLSINSQGNIENTSGVIKAGGDLIIGAKSISSNTIVHRYDFGNRQTGSFGEIAEISAGGDIVLRSYSDILIKAGIVTSDTGGITLAADGSIYIGPQQYTTHYEGRNTQSTRTQILQSYLTAEQNIQLMAQGAILIDAAELYSDQGHIDLLAQMGITIEDELKHSQFSGKWKKNDKTIESYKSVAMRSILDAGLGVRIHSEFGDITLRAVDISTTEGTNVKAATGAVNLLLTKETDHYSYSEVRKSLFTTTTISRGHNIETAVQNTIVGGFQVEALKGLNVEYEGVEGGNFNDQIEAFKEIEGLAWLADLQNNPDIDVDWTMVETVYDTWDEKNTSLSPAAMAVLAIVVSVVTAGAGAALYAAAQGVAVSAVGATTAAVMNAGFTALISTAASASANALVNGGSPLEVFEAGYEAVLSEDGLRSIATSMVTAWAVAQVDAEFFTEIDPEKVESSVLFDATDSLSLQGQVVQSVTHSAVSAGTSTLINGGDFGDFGDQFITNVANAGVNALGEKMATEIGKEFKAGNINNAVRYIAHAGAGCILGAAKAGISESDTSSGCTMGAGGAVVGEIVADVQKSATQVGQDAEKLEEFLAKHGLTDPSSLTPAQKAQLKNLDIKSTAAELATFSKNTVDLAKLSGALAAFVAGGDASHVNTAAFTAENAAENNALFLIPIAIALLKVIDVALTIKDFKDLHDVCSDPSKSSDCQSRLQDMAVEKGIEIAASQLLPGAKSFKEFGEWLLGLGLISKKNADDIIEEAREIQEVANKEGAVPTNSGYINKTKCGESGCVADLDGATEKVLMGQLQAKKARQDELYELKKTAMGDELAEINAEIGRLNNEFGELTEQLTEAWAARKGVTKVGTQDELTYSISGSSGTNNGIDHLFSRVDPDTGEEILMVVDSKQYTSSGVKLGSSSDGMQLSDNWLEGVLGKIPESSTKTKLDDALMEGRIEYYVTAADKTNGEMLFIKVDANSVGQ